MLNLSSAFINTQLKKICMRIGFPFFLMLSFFLFNLNLSSNAQDTKRIPPEKPKLVIVLVIEQMRNDYLQRFWDNFGSKGFKRLINEGTYFKNASYEYMLNHTGSGIATLMTGSQPSSHGIIADEWFSQLKARNIESTEDESVIGIGGTNINGARSAVNLFGSTISDELRLSNNLQSRGFSVSTNATASIFGGGHLANTAWWFDNETGTMMTSSHYTDSLPDWVKEFNSKKFAELYLNRQWELSMPLNQYIKSLPEINPFKIPFDSQNNSFPYDLRRIRGRSTRFDLLNLTPFGNTFTKDFALSLLVNENLGKSDNTDFLFVSFSANSNIGHRFGILSVEMQDAYIKLDREIAHFLTFIDETYGKENVLLILTSDKGANHNAEYLESKGMPVATFNQMQALILLRSYLNATIGTGDWVKTYNSRQIYLNHQLIEDSKLSLVDIQDKVARFMLQFTGVTAAIPAYVLQQNYFGTGLNHKIQNGFIQKRSGDVIIVLQPGWNERINNINSSNTLAVTENHVPVVWYGWKINRASITRQIDITSIAPTLAILLGISPPQISSGQILNEVLR